MGYLSVSILKHLFDLLAPPDIIISFYFIPTLFHVLS